MVLETDRSPSPFSLPASETLPLQLSSLFSFPFPSSFTLSTFLHFLSVSLRTFTFTGLLLSPDLNSPPFHLSIAQKMDSWPHDEVSDDGSRWIFYQDFIKDEVLTSHRDFKEWSSRLEKYLAQEELKHVLAARPCYPLGVDVRQQDRTGWIDRMLDEAKVKALLLHTTPLENFKAYKGKSAFDIFQAVSMECANSAAREEEAAKRGKKRKWGDDGGPSTDVEI